MPEANTVAHSRPSPWQDAPWDILAEIFKHIHPSHILPPSAATVNTSKLTIDTSKLFAPLMRASSICQHWRRAIHSTPSYWAYIHIAGVEGEKLCKFIEWQVQLAGDMDLHIYMDILSGRGEELTFPIIMGYRHRWATLDIPLPLEMVHDLFPPDALMPKLQTLKLRINGSLEYFQGTLSSRSLSIQKSNAPLLRNMVLESFSPLPPIQLPWPQLKNLTFLYFSPYSEVVWTITPTLPLLESVEEFMFVWSPGLFVPSVGSPPIQFPQLGTLDLHAFLPPNDPATIVGSLISEINDISAPSLSALHLTFYNAQAQWIGALKQSALPAPLVQLHLERFNARSTQDLVQVLRGLPCLERLRIARGWPSNAEALLRALAQDDTLLPVLRDLALHQVEFQPETCLEMVQARVSPVSVRLEDRKLLRRVAITRFTVIRLSGDASEFETINSELHLYQDEHTDVVVKGAISGIPKITQVSQEL